jgi:hypothetical protein
VLHPSLLSSHSSQSQSQHFQGDKAKVLTRVYSLYLLHALSKLPEHKPLNASNSNSNSDNSNSSISSSGKEDNIIPMIHSGIAAEHHEHHQHHQHMGHAAAPQWMQPMLDEQLLIRAGGSDKVFLFVHGQCNWLGKYELIEKLGLHSRDIINSVPEPLLQAIPKGADLFNIDAE